MFSGIIESTGKVKRAKATSGTLRVDIEKPKSWKLDVGQSISVDGVCSTVVAHGKNSFAVEYMPETLKKTIAKHLKTGTMMNLERSLTLGKFIDGHLVQGHVDAVARVEEVKKNQSGYLIRVRIPKELTRYIVEHGSIALNGVALTVARLSSSRATVALIPHTLAHTNLGLLKKDSVVNVEVDLLARYILKARH